MTPVLVDGITLDVATQNPFGVGPPLMFRVEHGLRGSHFGYWRVEADFSAKSQYVTFAFRFSQPVHQLSFIILDIDRDDDRHESLTVAGWNGADAFAPAVVFLGSSVANPAPGVFSASGLRCYPDDAPLTNCNIEVRFDQAVDSVTFSYAPGGLAPDDPESTIMGISDLSWRSDVDVSAAISAPDTVNARALLTYAITLRNEGPAGAPDVVATATLPPEVTPLTASGGGVIAGSEVTWPAIPLLAAGDSVLYEVQVEAPASGVLEATVRATHAAYDTHESNNDGSWAEGTATTTVIEQADLVAIVAGPDTVGPPGAFGYLVTVRNEGPSAATDVLITDTLPAGVTFLGASDGGTESGGVVSWPAIASLAAGAEAARSLVVSALSPGSYTNIVAAGAATIDLVPSNNDGSGAGRVTTAVIELDEPAADLTALAAGPASAQAGSTAPSTATVRNEGPSPATDVVVSDTLPAGAAVVAVSDGGAAAAGVVTWPAIGTLLAGGARSYTVTITVPGTGPLVNVVAATAATADPDAANNDGSGAEGRVTTAVIEQADFLTLAVGPAAAQAGGSFVHTVTVHNDGPSPANQVVVTDTLSGGPVLPTASDGGFVSGGVVTWPAIPVLAAGQSVEYTVTMTAPSSGSVLSVVAATSTTDDPAPANHNGSAAASRVATAVTAVADLTIEAAGPATVAAGDPMEYRLVVRNNGPSPASAVAVTDTVPAGFLPTAASGGGTWVGRVVTWPVIASLVAGDSLVFTVRGTAPATGLLVNSATVGAATVEPDPSDNRALVMTSISAGVALNPAELVDTVTAGSPTAHAATGQVTVVGTGADTLSWTVTADAPWLTLVTASGQGSGTASWTLDVPSLRVGAYSDTLLVTLADGQADTVAIRVQVVAPFVAWLDAIDEILVGARLSETQRRYLDQEGNEDGTFNLGDVLALLERLGVPLDSPTLSRMTTAEKARRPQ